MRIRKQLLVFFAALTAVSFTSCEEDPVPSKIPSVPTQMGLEDGAVIKDTTISLSASGSIVEDQNCVVKYKIYCGTSVDDMQEFNENSKIELQPYTQYFWCAKAVSVVNSNNIADYSESSEVRTFYCVPPYNGWETDNAEGDWAAVVRFKGLKDVIKKGKVTVTPDKKGYPYQAELELAEGQDSCYLQLGNSHNPTNAAYTHWWDDEKNIFYEPIIYDFDISLDLKVGDKIFSITNKEREIILDKSSCVRDHEFNVYRLVKIGNQIWMAEDFRATSIVYNGKCYSLDEVESNVLNSEYIIQTLPSGAQGVVYLCESHDQVLGVRFGDGTKINNRCIMEYAEPKGFHIPTFEEWAELEKYYGVSEPTQEGFSDNYPYQYIAPSFYDYYSTINIYEKLFIGEESDIRMKMALINDDWLELEEERLNGNSQTSLFNARPFIGPGYGCIYWVKRTAKELDEDYYAYSAIALSPYSKGVLNSYGQVGSTRKAYYASIRMIKDK